MCQSEGICGQFDIRVTEDARAGMVGLAPKWVRLAPNGTNPGLSRSDFSAFGHLTQFGAKPTIPALAITT